MTTENIETSVRHTIPKRTEMPNSELKNLLSKLNFDPHPTKLRGTRKTKDVQAFSNPHSKLYDEFDNRFPKVRDEEGNLIRRRVDRDSIINEHTDTFYFGEPIATKIRVAQQVTYLEDGNIRFDTTFEQDHTVPTSEKLPIINI